MGSEMCIRDRIPSAKDYQDELDSNENSEEGQNGQLPKTDPEQYRYKSNINSENEKRISDLPKRNQEVQTDDDSIDLPNDNGVEVGTEKSTKIGLPKAQNLPMKDSRLNQFKENDQSFVHQSTAGTCLLYTSDAAEEEDSVDLGGRRIIKKKKTTKRIQEIENIQSKIHKNTQ